LTKAKAITEGISEIPKNKKGYLVHSDHLSDMLEAMSSTSYDEEHNSGLVSKYQVKMREPMQTRPDEMDSLI
jgi:vacuolar-type H+-ATPase subunit C/Vma6